MLSTRGEPRKIYFNNHKFSLTEYSTEHNIQNWSLTTNQLFSQPNRISGF